MTSFAYVVFTVLLLHCIYCQPIHSAIAPFAATVTLANSNCTEAKKLKVHRWREAGVQCTY